MAPHQALTYWLEGFAFHLSHFTEPDSLSRIDLRVVVNQILYLELGAVIQRVISGTHVRELGVTAPGRNGTAGQQRILCGDGAERAVGMPQPVGQLELVGTGIRRQRRAGSVDIGEIANPAGQSTGLLLRAEMDVPLAATCPFFSISPKCKVKASCSSSVSPWPR